MKIQKYSPQNEGVWNVFIEHSKNGTFMLNRSYMDYHSDRFVDRSLMFYDDKERLVALLPASLHGHELRSHGGLTYGGIISDRKMTTEKMLEIFSSLKQYMLSEGIEKLLYKRVPSIYYTYPSDEDLYALFVNDAKLVRRDVSTTIDLTDAISFSQRRLRNIKKALKENIIVEESRDFGKFIELLVEVLKSRHDAVPVHTAEELERLKEKNPDNIRMFVAKFRDEIIAGTVLYITPRVVHTQYLMSNKEGRQRGALDFVIRQVISLFRESHRFLDFGISTENSGKYLNTGLVTQKQEFGGRAVAYDFYELTV